MKWWIHFTSRCSWLFYLFHANRWKVRNREGRWRQIKRKWDRQGWWKRKRLACSEGGRGVLSNERCCSQNNQGLHFAVCSYLMYSMRCGSCCNKTIWASHWRALVANIFHRPKDSLRGWRNNHFSCATHLDWGDVSCREKVRPVQTWLGFTALYSCTEEKCLFQNIG